MQAEITKNIAVSLGFKDITNCVVLADRVKVRDLFYRLHFNT